MIDRRGDKDVFAFQADSGPLELAVVPAWDAFHQESQRGADLDVTATLTDAKGMKIAESNPASDTYAAVAASLAGGTYYLTVGASGSVNYSDWASLGQYYVSGRIPAGAGSSNQPPAAAFSVSVPPNASVPRTSAGAD